MKKIEYLVYRSGFNWAKHDPYEYKHLRTAQARARQLGAGTEIFSFTTSEAGFRLAPLMRRTRTGWKSLK